MPPWHAEGPHGVFRNDRRLSDADKQTILRWIDAGAKPGDLNEACRQSRTTRRGGRSARPTPSCAMPEEFAVPAAGTIEYQYFHVPTNFTEDKWVQAIEIMPGAREVVHHVLVYAKCRPRPAPPMRRRLRAPPARPRPLPLLIRNRAQSRMPPDPPRVDTLHAPPRQLGALDRHEAPGTNVIEFRRAPRSGFAPAPC